MNAKRLATALLAAALLASPAAAADFYVRADGSDTNTGAGPAPSQAWRTIQRALNAISSTGIVGGDIVHIMPGTYVESITLSSTFPTSDVRFLADTTGDIFGTPGSVTVQSPTGSTLLEFMNVGRLTFEGFRFVGANSGVSTIHIRNSSDCRLLRCETVGGIFGVEIESSTGIDLHNVLATQANASGIWISLSSGIQVANCTSASNVVDGVTASFSTGVVVQNCILVSNNNVGLSANSSGVTHSHNLYFNNGNNDQQGVSAGPTDLFVNPAFVGVNDFRLQASSPAIDAGVNLSTIGVFEDAFGTLRPGGAGFDIGYYEFPAPVPPNGRTILFVRESSTSYTASEQLRVTVFEDWGYTVVPIADDASQTAFDVAVSGANVAFVSETSDSTVLDTKLRNAPIGVVTEEPFNDDENGFTASNGSSVFRDSIQITDNSHPITEGFRLGAARVTPGNQEFTRASGTVAPGGNVLATAATPSLIAVDVGGELANTLAGNTFAAGRRVRLPWARGTFDFAELNNSGLYLLWRSIEWATLDSLVGHWRLDEVAGATNAIDSSAFGIDGVYQGSPTLDQPGIRGTAVVLGGPSDYVSVPANQMLNLRRSFAVTCWVRADNPTWLSVNSFISKRPQFAFGPIENTTQVRFELFDDTGATQFSVSFDVGSLHGGVQRWRHYAAVYDFPNGLLTLYVDGVSRATQAVTPATLLASDLDELRLGRDDASGLNGYLRGRLDDVRVYNRTLSTAEISELYGLVGHWRLDETGGGVAVDSSGIENDGGYLNGAAPNSAGPYPGEGAVAAEFDGGSEIVSVPSNPVYDITEAISIAAWIRFDNRLQSHANQHVLLSRSQFDNRRGYDLFTDQPFSNNLTFRLFDGANFFDASWADPNIRAGQWHHVAAVYDGTDMRLYVDGQLRATNSSLAGPIVPADRDIGVGFGVDGGMFDVRLYNRAITNEEIAELYGLIGHWEFDESAGAVAADSTLFANDASFLVGTPQWVTGRDGGAIEFDGGSDATTAENFDPPPVGAVAFWMRSNGPPAGRQRPFGVGDAFEAYQDPGGLLILDVSITGPPDTFGPPTPVVDAGQWYHIVANYNSETNEIETYLDGVLVQSEVYSADLTDQPASRLSFGNRTGATGYFNGALDDFRIYNRWLSAVEIAKLIKRVSNSGPRVIGWTETR